MLKFGNREFNNLQEQVLENANDILEIKQSLGTALPNPIAGPTGPQGPVGATGPQGTRGSLWTVGTELPASANNGDIHLKFNGEVYIYNNGWILSTSILGPQGVQGPVGATGATGATGPVGPTGPQGTPAPIYSVQGILADVSQLPSPDTVPTNYAYIIDNDVYGIVGGEWEEIISLVTYANANQVTFAPTEDITSNNVQSAIEEVYTDTTQAVDNISSRIDSLEENIEFTKANKDGYYQQMRVGLADNIASPDGITEDATLAFRPTGGTASITDGYAEIKELKGRTLVINQLVQSGVTNSVELFYNNYYLHRNAQNELNIIVEPNSPSSQLLISDSTVEKVIDLTKMFGVGKEPTTVAEFCNLTRYIDTDTYLEGVFEDMRTEVIETVGFNAFDGELVQGYSWSSTGEKVANADRTCCKNKISVVAGQKYTIYTKGVDCDIVYIFQFDKKGNIITPTKTPELGIAESYYIYFTSPSNNAREFTCEDNTTQIVFFFNKSGGVVLDNPQICLHLTHSGYRNGQYEPYWKERREMTVVNTYFPDGMRSVGDIYDSLTPTKAIQRIGQRAYQEGDENDSSVVTDMTTTYYVLSTPVETAITDSRASDWFYRVSDFGTEDSTYSFLRADIFYMNNLRDKVRNLPDIPKCVTTGTYTLKCINGTYTWVED